MKKPKDRRGFQVIFQNPFYSFNSQKTIRSAFEEMLRWNACKDEQPASRQQHELFCRNESREEYRKQDGVEQKEDTLRRCLEPTGLPESVLDKYLSAFSGWELQRLAVARALTGKPQVLILDEPTSALDVITQKKLLDDMLPLLKDKTMLLIGHDTCIITYCADVILTFFHVPVPRKPLFW